MANEEPSSAGDMVKAFTKAGDGTNLWTETKKTFSMGDGKSKKGDVLVGDIPGALAGLKAMVEEAKQAAAKKGGKKLTMWDFRASPHAAFGRTLDDTFTPFLMWARLGKDGKEDDDDDTSGQINVSKAFRRLESYAEWMEDTGTELTEPKLECDQGMLDVIKKFGMSTSLANAGTNPGLLLWWIDMGGIDKAEIAALPVSDVFRAFVWYSHAIMYDAKAQENGIGLVENLASMGFWTAITLIPAKVSAKLDRLTIGVLSKAGAGAELKANWQLPVGSYKSTFPVVDMTPETSSAEIALNVRNGKEGTLDYISRHVQIEAVFNRGLNVLKKERTSPTQLRLQVKGSSLRVKSFVRWCYNGPWMARADEVTIDWL